VSIQLLRKRWKLEAVKFWRKR